MAWYRIAENVLDAIANAINAKTGHTAPMTPAEMVLEIQSIQTGGASWTHYQYTQVEDWLSNSTDKGNIKAFYDAYLSGKTSGKITYVIISNNSATTTSKATTAIGYGSNFVYRRLANPATMYNTQYDFFLSAGSVIDIYTTDIPNGGA